MPAWVRLTRRLRLSAGSTVTDNQPSRSRGLRFCASAERSMTRIAASSDRLVTWLRAICIRIERWVERSPEGASSAS
uniref:Uncharacterized protein n=1 Tax=Tanacetum cinerariifolium TaxID=118510 RepID=A0A699VY06_TANCI|nr:hypothetical protein [Tanacetum cinerariifolium]